MAAREPITTVDPDFSSKDARTRLGAAEVFWISTVGRDGRPHGTPLIAVWLDDALFFTTGESERKAIASSRPGATDWPRAWRDGSPTTSVCGASPTRTRSSTVAIGASR